jgi:hypothetical protein
LQEAGHLDREPLSPKILVIGDQNGGCDMDRYAVCTKAGLEILAVCGTVPQAAC